MIPVTAFHDQTIAVFGLGKAGIAAAHALDLGGASVWAWDDDADMRKRAEAQGVTLTDLYVCDWEKPRALVLSPGVPLTHPKPHPVADLAMAHTRPVIGEVELLGWTLPEATYVAITGTNGKSTTTALIGHVLGRAGRAVQAGGNLGTPALALERLGADGIYVLEMSSYQLDLTHTMVFDVAVWLNVTPDHLDRHGGMDGYVAAKRRIFAGQREGCTAIIGVDDAVSRTVYEALKDNGGAKVIPISTAGPVAGGIYVAGGVLIDATGGDRFEVMPMADAPALPGAHNGQNAAAAYAACLAAGLTSQEIVDGIASFPGLAHRQERVGERDGVVFVNDSKATNAEAANRALDSYGAIYWIAGGKPKESGLQASLNHLGSVRHAFLIGEAASAFAATLDGRVPVTVSGTLDAAVAAAWEAARRDGLAGATVLLSPACASFDQFANFEARGDAFREAVKAVIQ